MPRPKRKGELIALNVRINIDLYNELDLRSTLSYKSKAAITEYALKEYFDNHPRQSRMVDYNKLERKLEALESNEVEFLKKSENKIIDSDVRVSVMGTSRSKIIKFSFNKESLELIGDTDYISVSKVNRDSKILYFDESDKENGFKIKRTDYGGIITVSNRAFAEAISEADWEGDYKLEVNKNYFCIKKHEQE